MTEALFVAVGELDGGVRFADSWKSMDAKCGPSLSRFLLGVGWLFAFPTARYQAPFYLFHQGVPSRKPAVPWERDPKPPLDRLAGHSQCLDAAVNENLRDLRYLTRCGLAYIDQFLGQISTGVSKSAFEYMWISLVLVCSPGQFVFVVRKCRQV